MNNVATLKLISGHEGLIIDPSDGQKTILASKDIFNIHIDSSFKDLGLDKPGIATGEMVVNIYEAMTSGMPANKFLDLSPDLDKHVVTQSQIVGFCEKYRSWFFQEEASSTFFLTKKDFNQPARYPVRKDLFLVSVKAILGGLFADASCFIDEFSWLSVYSHRIISPVFLAA